MNYSTANSKLVAPRTLTSNDCLALVVCYAFDKKQFFDKRILTISKKAYEYFSKKEVQSILNKPDRCLKINQLSDAEVIY